MFAPSLPAATIAERVAQYGAAARQRLQPLFSAAGVAYPPATITLVGLKRESVLYLYAADRGGQQRFITAYPILAASGAAGPKLREGDRQVPEGLYRIELLNPNSGYHLSLRLSYPNAFDRRMALAEQRSHLGGDIMIHGSDVSIGCLAMGDTVAEDVFILAADTGIEHIDVILAPTDLRYSPAPHDASLPRWSTALYRDIRNALARLPDPRR